MSSVVRCPIVLGLRNRLLKPKFSARSHSTGLPELSSAQNISMDRTAQCVDSQRSTPRMP